MLDDLKKDLLTHLPKAGKVGIACSGGVDSMVLLRLMLELLGPNKIACLHYDHKVRKDSHKTASFLKDFCESIGLDFITETRSGSLDKDSENSLRNLRYSFFEEACKREKIATIYQAHNMNDNVETFIFRIFRGTNLSGLSSIPLRRRLGGIDIVRPLLSVTKEQILNYASENKVEFIEDYTNKQIKYIRNFIRHKILPLAKKINPKFLFNIKKLIDLKIEEEDFLFNIVEEHSVGIREMPIDLELMRSKPKYIQRKILENLFTTNIDFVNQFLKAIEEGGFHRINFKNDKFFTIKQKQISLEKTGEF
jgi:tRNA(Ile)-lysidine synthase